METVGNININFSIFSDDAKHITVCDLSDWVYAENQPSYITIQVPGSKKTKNFTFVKGKLNIFNSHNLGFSCLQGDCTEEQYVELPDGIYTVCVKSNYQGIETTKSYLKTDIFEVGFSKVMIKYGFEYKEEGKDFLLYMMNIKGIMEVAKSHAMLGDFVKAQRFFCEAEKLLEKYVDCKNCI